MMRFKCRCSTKYVAIGLAKLIFAVPMLGSFIALYAAVLLVIAANLTLGSRSRRPLRTSYKRFR
jgi:hypothetical protein